MPSAPFDATSDERELARLAYSRPADGFDPGKAQAQLAAMAAARQPVPEPEWHPQSVPATTTRREQLFIAAATAVVLAVASAFAAAPTSSLDVFDSTQVDVPTWPGGGGNDVRWLASRNGWDVFGFITTGGSICLATFDGPVTAGGACTSRGVFEIIGLRMGTSRIGTSRIAGDSTQYLSVKWGPTGDARLSDLPLRDWDN